MRRIAKPGYVFLTCETRIEPLLVIMDDIGHDIKWRSSVGTLYRKAMEGVAVHREQRYVVGRYCW